MCCFYVTVFLDFDDKAKLITSIKRSIGNYIRNDKEFYIGISSGSDREHAMKRRFDKYKKENNLNKMVTLFETDNQDTVRHIEDKLIHHYRENDNCLNRTGGGGGRDSEGPKYQVYIAFKE